MLRRKLMLHLGILVGLIVVVGATAVLALQDVLRSLDHTQHEAWPAVTDVNTLSVAVNQIESDLYGLQVDAQRHLDGLIQRVTEADSVLARVESRYIAAEGETAAIVQRMRDRMESFKDHVGRLATAQNDELAQRYTLEALRTAVSLREDTLPLGRLVREHASVEQYELTRWLRWVVLGLTLVFVLLVNVSVLVLVRLASVILKPVDALVDAAERLGREEFEHRVQVRQHDEFDRLAQAFNALAEHLQANEKRRLETIGQVSLALNHELNNAMAIIQLQLSLLGRQARGNPAQEASLRQIGQGLERMSAALATLQNIRRIVLTNYLDGVTMLDLEKSAQIDAPVEAPLPTRV